MIELLDSVTTLGDNNREVYDLLLNSLRLLSGQASAKRVARIFEIKLLGLLGLMPNLRECANCGGQPGVNPRFSLHHGGLICKQCLDTDKMAVSILPGTVKYMEHIRSSSFDRAAMVRVSSEVGKDLERALRRFLDYHIERRLKTVQFIKDIE